MIGRLAIPLAIAATLTLPARAAEPAARFASDFEIARMETQLARTTAFEPQVSGRLNLGDLRVVRNELALARSEYTKALDLAERERKTARVDSSLSRYAVATSYAALAEAKLRREAEAVALLGEAERYASDDAETWNLHASVMRTLGYPQKGISAARNAVAIASRDTSRSTAGRLDLAVYQYALATALVEGGKPDEARQLLVAVTEALRGSDFDALRRQVARDEAFEVYSSARGDVAAYVSLLNRAQLRLATLDEEAGDTTRARQQYRRVLDARSDDVVALTAMARLAPSEAERAQRYAEAFDANPFSMTLVRNYRSWAAAHAGLARHGLNATTGGEVRRAVGQLAEGDTRGARATLDRLLQKFPSNDTLRALRREAEAPASIAIPSAQASGAELRALLEGFEALTPEQRVQLDQATFTSTSSFAPPAAAAAAPGQTIVERGTIEEVPFRFATATAFAGTFDLASPLQLTYRILGVTRDGDADVLLLEPVRLERKEQR